MIRAFKRLTKTSFYYQIQKNNYDYVFGNTILSLNEVLKIKRLLPKIKTILHFHESKFQVEYYFDDVEDFKNRIKKVDKIIAVTNYVKNYLKTELRIDESNIEVCFPFVINKRKSNVRDNHSKKLNLGFIGYPDLTKGFDLVPQIALNLLSGLSVPFVINCIGMSSTALYKTVLQDLNKLELTEYVKLYPNQKNIDDFYNTMDLLLMISREESFSIVTAEAIMNNIPVICFDKSGGPVEIVGNNKLLILEHLSIPSLVQKIIHFTENKERYFDVIKDLKPKVEENTNKNEQCEKLFRIAFED